MASINAKGHHHEWQSKPPDGKLEWSKTWDERYWDEEELAANFMYSSPEEISRLKNLLKQDPGFENSSSWPHLTEWCSTCTATRSMKLVLPEEEAKVPMEEEEEVVKKGKNMEVVKEKEYCPREGVSSSGSPIFTLRNSQTGASTPPPKPQTPWPDAPPFPPPPLFTSPLLPPNQTPQYCATPAANWGFCGGCHCWGPVLPIWVAQ